MRTRITKEQLEHEIEKVFPILEMPLSNEISFHSYECKKCKGLLDEIEEMRSVPVTPDFLRVIHQELSFLSAKSWGWIFPYYIRFAITEEAKESEMEVQYFIYNLSPEDQFKRDTFKRLSEFNEAQVFCLISFLEWCLSQSCWNDSYGKSIQKGIRFLNDFRVSVKKE